ncbi:MAG: hypothetical protein UX04_C0001G0090 [Microgenomates group bacterium GW2011_GWF2_45_18]|nr:MAG: hypothetical protein UW18_C0003G0140 [Microgenomates group bacterium GW2011_GWF1_44_10]KKU02319.1 MAG: hypothetical protein UX04_C0001G0090 [Microgenomates group bacterium GW2011_GWF2_45_18]HAU99215.1 hypothetical protein [Candidatus Paceibacterota bacterium]HAX01746.1 hypothetical protein [Candidatus Paceibacterota bacterium]
MRVWYFFSILIVAIFLFRGIMRYPTTSLIDSNDYPLIVWIHSQHVAHLRNLELQQLFSSNAFYPHNETSMLFTEFLFPTGVFATLLSFFISSDVLIINVLFFLGMILNAFAFVRLWKRCFSGPTLYVLSFLSTFSPFFLLFYGHFQMVHLWPMIFALSFFLSEDKTKRDWIWFGFWFGVTVLSSVYLAVFLFVIALVWQATHFSLTKTWIFRELRFSIFALIPFLLVSGWVIIGYGDTQLRFEIKREAWEYVRYAADLADYGFTGRYNSVLNKLPLLQTYQSMQRSNGSVAFPTVVLTALALLGIWNARKHWSKLDSFALALMIAGFLFSIGTRLTFQGEYLAIRLPFLVFIKLFPFLEIVRAPSRWYFLLILGMLFFVGKTMKKIQNNSSWWLILVVLLYILESFPVYSPRSFVEYRPTIAVLRSACKENKKLLHIPMMFVKEDREIGQVVQYWSQNMFDSTSHSCIMSDGYSGFFPKYHRNLQERIEQTLQDGDSDGFWSTISSTGVEVLEVSFSAMPDSWGVIVSETYNEHGWSSIFSDESHMILVKETT